MEAKGYVSEVFGSFQGEGPYIGERHVFVRFSGCSLGCAYCDTPGSAGPAAHACLEDGPGLGETLVDNPVSVETVAGAVLAQEAYPGFNSMLSLTGGEPLEQPEFAGALLAGLGGRFKVLLETNGTLAEELPAIAGLVDVVSMDVKLPSLSGLPPMWELHGAFMDACRGKTLVIKAVVAGHTPAEEVARAAGLAARHAPGATFVIQPLTGPDGRPEVDGLHLLEFYRDARGIMDNVRVIPQVHGILGVK